MNIFQKTFLVLTRVVLGWLFFWAGLTKLLDPAWSAAGYLNTAKTFPEFYHWLASPAILPLTNFLNAWGLTLVGISLILGIFVRWSTKIGALIMVLYYLPILQFPYPDAHSFIVDEHIVYASVLLLLGSMRAGTVFGIGRLKEWLR